MNLKERFTIMLYYIYLVVFLWVSIWGFVRFFNGHPGSAVLVTAIVSYLGAILTSGHEGDLAWDILYVLYSYEVLLTIIIFPFIAFMYYNAYKSDIQEFFSKSKETY